MTQCGAGYDTHPRGLSQLLSVHAARKNIINGLRGVTHIWFAGNVGGYPLIVQAVRDNTQFVAHFVIDALRASLDAGFVRGEDGG